MSQQAPFSPDMREFLWLLAKYRVRYLIVGGEAVIFYGHARLTGDIDIFYSTLEENTDRLYSALTEFWDGKIPGLKKAAELMEVGAIYQFGVPPNRIDLLNELDEVDFEGSWERRRAQYITHKRAKFSISYIGLEDLISNKRAVGRDRDRDDLAFLVKARKQLRAKTRRP